MDVEDLCELHRDYSNQSAASREPAGQAGPGSCVQEDTHAMPESRDRELWQREGRTEGDRCLTPLQAGPQCALGAHPEEAPSSDP